LTSNGAPLQRFPQTMCHDWYSGKPRSWTSSPQKTELWSWIEPSKAPFSRGRGRSCHPRRGTQPPARWRRLGSIVEVLITISMLNWWFAKFSKLKHEFTLTLDTSRSKQAEAIKSASDATLKHSEEW